METVLSEIPAQLATERLLVVLIQTADGSRLELRQQSFGEGVGWFTQSTVQMEPGQVALLKNSLGAAAGNSAPRLPRSFSRVNAANWQPRLLRADSA